MNPLEGRLEISLEGFGVPRAKAVRKDGGLVVMGELGVLCLPCGNNGVLVSPEWLEWQKACEKLIRSGKSDLPPSPTHPREKICPVCDGVGFVLNQSGWQWSRFMRRVFKLEYQPGVKLQAEKAGHEIAE